MSRHIIPVDIRDPKWLGGQLNISILHTHGQELSFHPHIHCIVSGGGINKDGQWQINKRALLTFSFPTSGDGTDVQGLFPTSRNADVGRWRFEE
ncbi:MAG: transposase [Saprospiraceae bacterium]|nr:transposase [Saprospiraceae bacterium]